MKHFIKLLKREFKLFLSNTTLVTVFFLAPIFYAILLGLTYQKGKVDNIPVIVVNEDQTPLSNQLVQMLEDNSNITILNYIQKPASIKDEIIEKDASAVVIIPDRFEAMMLQKRNPEVNVYVNTANVLTANFATKAIQLTIGTFSAGAEIKAIQRTGVSEKIAKTNYEPFKTNYITLYNPTGNYLIFMWPAMMAVVLQQVILLAMAVSFASEFKRGSFTKDFAEKKKYAIFVMFVKCFPIWFFAGFNLLFFYLASLYFKIPLPYDVLSFLKLSFIFIVASTNLGVFFSVLVPNSLKATQILMVIASPAFIISGFTWPRYSMPEAVVYITEIIPLTPYLEALKIIVIQKGASFLTDGYFTHLFIQAWIYFIIGWIALKIKLYYHFKNNPI